MRQGATCSGTIDAEANHGAQLPRSFAGVCVRELL